LSALPVLRLYSDHAISGANAATTELDWIIRRIEAASVAAICYGAIRWGVLKVAETWNLCVDARHHPRRKDRGAGVGDGIIGDVVHPLVK
jgi:hypothetical protein